VRLRFSLAGARNRWRLAALRADVTTGNVRVERFGKPKCGVKRENAFGPIGRRNQDD
jgi:hypothetical protein